MVINFDFKTKKGMISIIPFYWWWIEIEMAITDTLKQKVSVIKNISRPYFTYISRYGASSPFVMNEGI